MKEVDEELKKRCHANPFSVPENYFENLTREVMDKLPEKDGFSRGKKRLILWERVRPWIYLAAMLIAVLLPLRYFPYGREDKPVGGIVSVAGADMPGDEFIEAMIDDSMIDDYTLYQYLTNTDADY